MAHLPHRAIKSRNLAERCWSDLAESGTLCRDNVGGRRGDSALRADFYVAPCVGAISPEAVTPRGEPVVRQQRVEPSLRETELQAYTKVSTDTIVQLARVTPPNIVRCVHVLSRPI